MNAKYKILEQPPAYTELAHEQGNGADNALENAAKLPAYSAISPPLVSKVNPE
jgi:hypothetical protein